MDERGTKHPGDRDRDRGSVMPMTAILIVFLMLGGWALLSASQQWNARRDAHAVAAAAARAGAQGDELTLRSSRVVDPVGAVARAEAILAASGMTGRVSVDDESVTVTATATVDYAFPSPGFPSAISATATAVAVTGVVEAAP